MYFKDAQVIGICGAGWGDEGKGKFTDEAAGEADVIVRAQGGCNAGHTVVIEGKKYKFHQLPSGIMYAGRTNVIGNGVVLDPRVLVEEELPQMTAISHDISGLCISGDAHVIMPWHRLLDKAREWSLRRGKIGTTARGIGPAYMDKAQRCGVRLNDIFSPTFFAEKCAALAAEKEKMLYQTYDVPRTLVAEWMGMSDQRAEWFADGHFCVEAMCASYRAWCAELQPYVTDTRAIVHAAYAAGKKILLEGAQGLLLDIDHGTYPYVTSSNCAASGFATGAGVPPGIISRVYNVMPAYMTRVGSGPFPTELGTEEQIASENASARMSFEESSALARERTDAYSLGKVLRHVAGEFGTTTGRPRRTGWFDAVAYAHAVRVNGPDVIISKLDVLDVMPSIRVCTSYRYTGSPVWYNGTHLESGAELPTFPTDARILALCEPCSYAAYEGWLTTTTGVRRYADLPESARAYLEGLAQHTGCCIRRVSVGPSRNQTFEAQ